MKFSMAIVLSVCMLFGTGCGAKPAGTETETPTGDIVAAFSFGKQAHDFHPENVDEFIPVFAEEMARYNKIAALCWPDNAVMGKSVVLEDVDTNRFWYIMPDGAATELSEKNVEQMGVFR